MKNFWEKLPKPFFCLAPMADVTDAAFRRIITKYGKPDILWTEFVSADGLMSKGRDALKNNLVFIKREKVIIAQLFSSNCIKMRQASAYVASLGFDGIDINMGCPDRSIEKQGSGAAMMKDFNKAKEIIQAVKDGIQDAKKNISVSVKTRIGYNKIEIKEWIPFLLSQKIDALTIHARTRKEMSKVPARWKYLKETVEIRNKMGVKTKIIGNGDVLDLVHGFRLAQETGCDGVMIGRAVFGNPWIFSSLSSIRISKRMNIPLLENSSDDVNFLKYIPPLEERLKVLVEHTKLFERLLGSHKNFAIMRKHYKAYVNGFSGSKELRVKLMETVNAKEVEKIIKDFIKNNNLL